MIFATLPTASSGRGAYLPSLSYPGIAPATSPPGHGDDSTIRRDRRQAVCGRRPAFPCNQGLPIPPLPTCRIVLRTRIPNQGGPCPSAAGRPPWLASRCRTCHSLYHISIKVPTPPPIFCPQLPPPASRAQSLCRMARPACLPLHKSGIPSWGMFPNGRRSVGGARPRSRQSP